MSSQKLKKRNHYLLYKTTCLLTGKYYIGIHSTNNFDDGYLGSGKRIKRSIIKYGVENHIKEIIKECDDWCSLVEEEKKIVNEIMINDDKCLNLMVGGFGGWFIYNSNSDIQRERNKKSQEKQKFLYKNDKEWCNKRAEKLSLSNKRAMKEGRLPKINPLAFLGKKHTEETKRKIGEITSICQRGENNSQYGTCWIYSIENQKIIKIKKNVLQEWIDNGWIKGRKLCYKAR